MPTKDDDKIIIRAAPSTHSKWWAHRAHYDNHEEALLALLDAYAENPDELQTVD